MSPTKAAAKTATRATKAVVMRAKRYANGTYLAERYASKLGVADRGKSCVRFLRLDQLNEPALRSLLRAASKGAKSMSALSDGRHDRAHASR